MIFTTTSNLIWRRQVLGLLRKDIAKNNFVWTLIGLSETGRCSCNCPILRKILEFDRWNFFKLFELHKLPPSHIRSTNCVNELSLLKCNGIGNIPSVKWPALCKARQGSVEGVVLLLTVTNCVIYPPTLPQFLCSHFVFLSRRRIFALS